MSQNVYIGMTLKPWPILLDHSLNADGIAHYRAIMIIAGDCLNAIFNEQTMNA